jgi:hypothetical protein
MGFVPMQFRKTDSAASKAHLGEPFELAPAALAVEPPKPWKITDRRADGDRLDISDFSNDFEIHDADIVPAALRRAAIAT